MSLKILHVNYSDNNGGAAIAVQRIIQAQKLEGLKPRLLVAEKNSNNAEVFGPSSTIEEIKWKLLLSINRKFEKLEKKKKYDSNSYNLIPNNIVKKINQLDLDLVNLHWIGNNLIPINDIKKIKKPIVWTLHDMWPYTGSEHYSLQNRYIEGYNKKNKSGDLKGFDIERYCWNLKKKHYPKNLNIVATSDWQLKSSKESYLFKNFLIKKIQLPIDINFWKPLNKEYSKKELNLPLNKKNILIGSEKVDSIRKGFHLLKDILKKLNIKDVSFIFFGKIEEKNKLNIPEYEVNFLDNVNQNSYDLKLIYSAADLFLAPSIQESFGQTILEASCCNTPSVSFANNGISDVINHKYNGYIAIQNDINDFANGIKWCLKNITEMKMKENRNRLISQFSLKEIGKKYNNFYSSII